jgi:LacI family transcriptional regulator
MVDRAKVTIADVANAARVSVGTVSHVLSGRVRVRDKTLERVSRAIKELGFIPNFHAQGLRQSSSLIIGLCLPHLVNSFMSGLSQTLEEISTVSGYSIMHIYSRQNPETELRRIKELLRFRIDGLIFHPSNTPRSTLDYLYALGIPVVLIDSANIDSRFDRVVLDNQSNMRRAVEQLIEVGHRRILFVCQWEHVGVTQSRMRGLIAAREEASVAISIRQISYGDNEAGLGVKLGAELSHAEPPTAIIASNSSQAALVIRILRDLPGQYPEKVSLLAFDDPEWSTLVSPQLSVIRQPAADSGKIAWDLMMRRLHGGTERPRKVVLEADIQMRGSVRAVKPRVQGRPKSTRKPSLA